MVRMDWIGLVVDSLMIWMLESWTPLLQRQAQIGEVATLDDFGCIKIYSKFAGKTLGKVLYVKRIIQYCTRKYST